MSSIYELSKNINWNILSIDCLLDFILTECKLLINSNELKETLAQEFKRRFQEDFESDYHETKSKKERSFSVNNKNTLHYKSFGQKTQNLKQLHNSHSNNNLETIFQSSRKKQHHRNYLEKFENKKNSFTSELIAKLISKDIKSYI